MKRLLLVIAPLLCALPLQAQWSAAPTLAIGPAIPAGALANGSNEGATFKAGLWLRAPRVPVGLTVEGMFVQFRDGRPGVARQDTRVGAVTANVTTRRHDRKLDLYGTAGAGWYWRDGPSDPFDEGQAPGVNVGVGEVVALGSRDYFVELRVHAIRTAARTGEPWMTFVPLVFGVRF